MKIQFDHYIFDQINENCRTFKQSDGDELIIATFSLAFERNGAGFSVPCDAAGNALTDELSDLLLEKYNDALVLESQGYWTKVECRPRVTLVRLCSCGSGEESEQHYDARGIYLCRACPKCEREQLGRYRSDVLSDPNYWADEEIEMEGVC
jgi:hypothetical protein